MNHFNSLIIYSFNNNIITNWISISYDLYKKWTNLENIYDVLKKNDVILKYLDEEEELISLVSDEDFVVFLEILLKKKFPNNEVFLIAHDKIFDRSKYGSMKNLNALKVKEHRVFLPKAKISHCADELSSSSSSSLELNKSKKHRSIKNYSAQLKKELNYLPGSEVRDGQIILKKWRIKNTGVKKWKANTIKCVLLPSEYSNWIEHSNVMVPVCFADQKVNIEMEIKIIGRWNEKQLKAESACQIIKLKWLLFVDKLVKESQCYFLDFILVQLELILNVKNRNIESINQDIELSNLKKQTSESSIEKIDQDFAIFDIPDDDEIKKLPFDLLINNQLNNLKIEFPVKKEILSDTDIELPDCPHDDFQITDFNQSKTFSAADNYNENETDMLISKDELKKKSSTEVDTPINVDISEEQIDILIEEIMNDDKLSILSIDEVKVNDGVNNVILEHTNIKFDENIEEIIDNDKMSNPIGKSICNEVVETEENFNELTVINKSLNDLRQSSEILNTPHKDNEVNILENILIPDNSINVNTNNNDKGNILNSVVLDERIQTGVNLITKDEKMDNYQCQNNSDKSIQYSLPNNSNEKKNFNSVVIEERILTDNNPITKEEKTENTCRNYTDRSIQYSVLNNLQNPSLNNWETNSQIRNSPNSYGYYQQPIYQAGINPTNIIHPLYSSPNQYYPINQAPILPNNGYQYPNINNQIPIQNQTSAEIIQSLARTGQIHSNINDITWERATNGQHYDFSIHMKKLEDMGFQDKNRNHRLLIKFNNDINDVLHELID